MFNANSRIVFKIPLFNLGMPENLEAVKGLMKLLSGNVTPIGKPFPTMIGPKTNEKVCIVGAGPAGLHMAVELKSRNFTNLSRQKTRPWAMLSAPDLNNQMTCRYEGFAYIPDEPKK